MHPQKTESPREHPATLLRFQSRELIDSVALFGNSHPLEVEIGCGKGKFLIARAMENPYINFLAVDVVWKWMKYGVRWSEKRALENIKFSKADVKEIIQYGLAPESVAVFHVYFPDPWPKRRHRKRRLVAGAFLELLHSRLVPRGLIELATDHPDYFKQMRAAVVQSGIHWRRVVETADERLFTAQSKTNYEFKYEAAGRRLNYLELQK